jgi:hypothetical protein
MEYRGIEFEIKIGTQRDEWVWTVHTIEPKTVRVEGSRDWAVARAKAFINAWCRRHPACAPAE